MTGDSDRSDRPGRSSSDRAPGRDRSSASNRSPAGDPSSGAARSSGARSPSGGRPSSGGRSSRTGRSSSAGPTSRAGRSSSAGGYGSGRSVEEDSRVSREAESHAGGSTGSIAVGSASVPGAPVDRGAVDDGTLEGAAPPADDRAAAERLFGDRLSLVVAYAQLLVTDGVVRGLIGPREAPRIWDRHLLNCAALAELVPADARVVDVGSGAGLPGIVLAIARPDVSVVLVEPLARRTAFLDEAIAALRLDHVSVVRARAEELVPVRGRPRIDRADIVTARAVAPLDRLTAWCLPLVADGGRLLALKGESATEEAGAHAEAIARLGGGAPVVRQCGVGVIEPPTTVVEIRRMTPVGRATRRRR